MPVQPNTSQRKTSATLLSKQLSLFGPLPTRKRPSYSLQGLMIWLVVLGLLLSLFSQFKYGDSLYAFGGAMGLVVLLIWTFAYLRTGSNRTSWLAIGWVAGFSLRNLVIALFVIWLLTLAVEF